MTKRGVVALGLGHWPAGCVARVKSVDTSSKPIIMKSGPPQPPLKRKNTYLLAMYSALAPPRLN